MDFLRIYMEDYLETNYTFHRFHACAVRMRFLYGK